MESSDQKRALLAVFLSGIVLFVWQTYFAPKSTFNENVETQTAPQVPGQTDTSNPGQSVEKAVPVPANNALTNAPADTAAPVVPTVEKITLKTTTGHEVTFDSNLTLSSFTNPNQVQTLQETTGKAEAMKFLVDDGTGRKIVPQFKIEQIGMDRFKGTDTATGLNIAGSLKEDGKLSVLLTSLKPFKYQFELPTEAKTTEDNRQRELVTYTKSADRNSVDEDNKDEMQLKWFGLDFHYHFFAVVFNKTLTSNVITKEKGSAYVDIVQPANSLEFEVLYTKKEYDHLKKLGSNLQNSVDFGFFGIVAVFILGGLQKVYSLIPNYGFAIILVTFLIRFLLFPLQYKSIKSMKSMQKIQPEIQKIREKYKDDQARLQKETMDLFRRTGANPLGGCLPMVLQMPVFFAFYQVLYNAVELVDAPFMLWITDLSVKDPYYVLPVLMGVTFFLQTKLNPTPTTDPTQAKMMMFMPLVFTFIMKDLPAGLNLYFTISTLFGILQQLVVYKFVK
jgi:YidC/Oxa1 family membrane protein insertase